MSEVTKAEERVPYVVELDEPLKFEHDAEVSILTSKELGSLANEYFKAAFPGDYEGCNIVYAHNRLSLCLYFRHENHVDGQVYGVELNGTNSTHNKLTDAIRRRDYLAKEGDRYSLTADGEDIVKPLLFRNLVSQNGKINQGQVVSEVADNTASNMYYGKPSQFTMVSGIDLNIVCALLFGKKDTDGNDVVYTVDCKGVKNPGAGYGQSSAGNLILWVNRINANKVGATCLNLGFGGVSNIIR